MRTVWLRTPSHRDQDFDGADVTIRSIDELTQIKW
jgi:hypothetical protein